ncbi:MAG: N-acetyltransferase [Gammaproteobacteria bacterium]|nr:N-acetyltransferase [Gammaproteobacteria bacterium]MDH3560325.1 N-acetyltransferase [Gammaproteobacteria bacterium]
MHEITVRPETSEDVRAIDVVHISAFGGEAEARLISALRAAASYNRELSLVAELNGRIVGHVLLTRVPVRKDGEEKIVLALGPMSVVPSQSHRGIGSVLIKASVELAREKGYGAIIVVGYPEYYQRFGFLPAKDIKVTCNLPAPADALTGMEIVEGNLAGGGHVEYPEPFLELY